MIIVQTLKQIVALPDALEKYACEYVHLEMCSLPNETFHCPACGSKVVPTNLASLCALVNPAAEGKQGRPVRERGERRAGLKDGEVRPM
jgi:hypothetical protein